MLSPTAFENVTQKHSHLLFIQQAVGTIKQGVGLYSSSVDQTDSRPLGQYFRYGILHSRIGKFADRSKQLT